MADWIDEFKDFELRDDGCQLFAEGVDIDAIDIIKILDNIAGDEKNGNNKIEVLKIEHCRIKDDLDIWNPGAGSNFKRFRENGLRYIQLPTIILSFSSTVFEGSVPFERVRFRGVTLFTGAQFRKSTNFYKAQFGEKANFTGARFEGIASFLEARFGGQANFLGTRFGESAQFDEAEVGEKADFRIAAQFTGAQFGEKAIFNRARFRGVTDFRGARFRKEADFPMVRFREETHFDSVQFGEKTDFNGAQFKIPANFTDVKYWPDFVRVTWARWLWKDKLFSIDLKFQNVLESCGSILDSGARELYKKFKNKGISLSGATTISIDKTDTKWLIIDTKNNKTYRVQKEEEKLNVYGDSSRNQKIRKILHLPDISPEGEPPEPAQFKLDSQNIDEVTNLHFKRYVADQRFLRDIEKNHRFLFRLWRWSSSCGRSIGLWTSWSVMIALFFGFAYQNIYWIFLVLGIIPLAIGGFFLWRDFVSDIRKIIRKYKCEKIIRKCELLNIIREKWLRCYIICC